MATGFAISNNLSESRGATDESILNNLAFSGIANSFRLFAGNSSQISKIEPGDYKVNDDLIRVVKAGKTGLSNRTIVQINNREYIVYDSDGQTEFRLRRRDTGSRYVPNPTVDTLIRNDSITFQNLNNLDVTRFETNVENDDIDESDDLVNRNSLYNRNTISENLDSISETLGSFYLIQNRVPLTIGTTEFDTSIQFNGTIRVTNSNQISISDPNAPGLFIVSESGEALRAFSDTSNPWSEENSSLKTDAVTASIQKLVLESKSLNIEGITPETVSSAQSVNNYTHKLPVKINGEEFFLLLKE
jgi:hypothetical protein